MAISSRARSLVVRLILLPPTIVFGLMALKYLTHPVPALVALDIAGNSPLAVTTLRVFFGALPLGSSLFILGCILSTRWLLTGLVFVVTMTSAILTVRILGMLADDTVEKYLRPASAEAVVLILAILGIFFELSRRRQLNATL